MPTASPDAPARPSSASSFARGLRLGLPVLLGYMPVGAAFGVLATTAGFSVAQAVASSAFVFAGAGQFVALDLLKAGAGLAAVLVATGVLNLRHILFGATLSPYLRGASGQRQAPLAFTLTDETFGINVTDLRAGTADAFSMLGVGAISWFGWTFGTAIGAVAAPFMGDPAGWGVDFAMPAMFTALLVAQITNTRYAVAAAVAALLTIGCTFVLPGTWPLITAAMGAATVATVMDR